MRSLLAGGLSLAVSTCAPPPPPPPPPEPPMPREFAVLPEPLRISIEPYLLRSAEEARGLSLGQPLDVRSVTQVELVRILKQQADAELPRDFLSLEGELLRAMGAIPDDLDWRDHLLDLLPRVVEGLWLASSDRLLLSDVIVSDRDALIRHEIVHALQDRHFDLDGLLSFLPGESDRQAARLHLVEGDAVEAVRRTRIAVRETTVSPKGHTPSPPYLTRLLASPYEAGADFVRAVHDAEGIPGVNRAFAAPPVSTEQVLHPNKYFAHELPLSVMLPNLPREGAVWEHVDTFGELALGSLFTEWIGKELGQGVASGWGGDRIALGKTTKGTVATLVVAMDARELADRVSVALADAFPGGCRARVKFGPLAFAQRDELLGFFAGPYVEGEVVPTCAEVQRELTIVLRGVQITRPASASL